MFLSCRSLSVEIRNFSLKWCDDTHISSTVCFSGQHDETIDAVEDYEKASVPRLQGGQFLKQRNHMRSTLGTDARKYKLLVECRRLQTVQLTQTRHQQQDYLDCGITLFLTLIFVTFNFDLTATVSSNDNDKQWRIWDFGKRGTVERQRRESWGAVRAEGRWVREGVSPSRWGGIWEGAGHSPLPRKFMNFLNENGVFWCTLEHCFKVNVTATEGLAPDVHALCL